MFFSFKQLVTSSLSALLLMLIRGYQWLLSPVVGQQCRFHPTCSHYTAQAIQLHGPFVGSLLGICRICRCNPLGGSGVDFPPYKLSSSAFLKPSLNHSLQDHCDGP